MLYIECEWHSSVQNSQGTAMHLLTQCIFNTSVYSNILRWSRYLIWVDFNVRLWHLEGAIRPHGEAGPSKVYLSTSYLLGPWDRGPPKKKVGPDQRSLTNHNKPTTLEDVIDTLFTVLFHNATLALHKSVGLKNELLCFY